MINSKITSCGVGWDDSLRAALNAVNLTGTVAVE